MEVENVINTSLNDLALVAATVPNERLPKEEQIRCSIYAALRPAFRVVCAERGYASIDDGSRIECDLWAQNPGSPPVWIEFKRCWSACKWNNKPREQLRDWEADVAKLRGLPLSSERYFILLGLFDCNPSLKTDTILTDVLANIRGFYPENLVHQSACEFTWREGDGITWVGAWVWCWKPGDKIPNFSES